MRPRLILAMGATAAQSLLGPRFRISAHRGELLALPGDVDSRERPHLLVTVHPAALLRDRSGDRDQAYRLFVDDLGRPRDLVSAPPV